MSRRKTGPPGRAPRKPQVPEPPDLFAGTDAAAAAVPLGASELDVAVEETMAVIERDRPGGAVDPTAASGGPGVAPVAGDKAGTAVRTGSGGSGSPPGVSGSAVDAGDESRVPLSVFASRAYLDYAMSVLKGRALPDVADGQKPVQRRILYVMHELGLAPGAKPMKSARVVGDVLGKYHPHGDIAAYEAMVRMAQSFSLRYPLVDGHGNYGSRDGDAAAAYRYTEARLTDFANHVLLSEIDQGTVDLLPNYDGSFREPALLPARLPVVLLNGASGIAVGMATEIPAHNLTEVAAAVIAVIRAGERKPPGLDPILALLPGPDFPGGGQIISPAREIREAYATGRGTIRLRARWKFEELARSQWQAVITELPHGVSTARVLSEIEEISNPKVRTGRKSVTPEQQQQKVQLLSVLERIRDESDKSNPVRIVVDPRTSKVDRTELMTTLLALTSLETTYSINLVVLGRDGRPRQKGLVDVLAEWADFRIATVGRRLAYRLERVAERIHVLEGRLVVHLNVDKVIRTIRESDDPKAALIQRFKLSDRQAEDILEMRLRQLARLESIRIEQELKELGGERSEIEDLLRNPSSLRRRVIREIESDAKRFGDRRRTLIEEDDSAARVQTLVDEPVTVLVSERGWVKARTAHGLDPATFTFKEGDRLRAAFEVRSVDPVIAMASDGRVFTIPVAALPGGKTDGAPASSLIDLAPGTRIVHLFAAPPDRMVILAASSGYGFACAVSDLVGRQRGGKQFVILESGEVPLSPALVEPDATRVVGVTSDGKLHAFPLAELRVQSGGGRGVQTVVPDERATLVALVAIGLGVVIVGTGRGGKPAQLVLSARQLAEYTGKRARKGHPLPTRIRPSGMLPLLPEGRVPVPI